MSDDVKALSGRRVFLAEGTFANLLALQFILHGTDCLIAATAERFSEALHVARSGDFDVALIDAELPGGPIERILSERGIPVVFATRDGRPPSVSKRYHSASVIAALARAVSERDKGGATSSRERRSALTPIQSSTTAAVSIRTPPRT